ncbi:MAG: transketolase [Geobacter sp.]|nr:transketolase [Geobacter sp.]
MPKTLTPAQELLLGANTLRMLAVDAVEQAASGHPGLPMGAADYSFLLWHRFLRFDPADPSWADRDRFILSAGHGSMLLYGLLHLFGFDLPLAELQRFRQWGSRTPGHPEYGHTPGVEMTTGPLGQGFAAGVGMALASRMAAARFADDQFSPISHRVYAIVSDGDLMEGVSYEAASLAGHLRLGNLIYLYDDNCITIEGATGLAFSEDVEKRFGACGWQVQRVDGHAPDEVAAALVSAREETERPSLIMARTRIAKGSPGKEGSAAAHGSPLGSAEAAATRRALDWPEEPFHVPAAVRALCGARVEELTAQSASWRESFARWQERNPDRARLWDRMWQKKIPEGLIPTLLEAAGTNDGATRSLSGAVLQAAAAAIPSLAGGSADLAPSTNSWIKESDAIAAGSFLGRNLHFGIREHAMAAIQNGMALYGCFIPFGATFLVFSDYCRPAVRLAALMKLQTIYLFTHDSIFVGEDGPTHQPVEHLSALRMIPNLQVIRPADGIETALAWGAALERRHGPTALILSRQKLPRIQRDPAFGTDLQLLAGTIVFDTAGNDLRAILLASGSEVHLAMAAAQLLQADGVQTRVISVPCLERLLALSPEERERLIPPTIPRIAIEAGRGALWHQILAHDDLFIGIETFGASAPEEAIAEQFGFTPQQVAARIRIFLHL